MKSLWKRAVLAMLLILLPTAHVPARAQAGFRAAAGKVDITPSDSVYMAGYGIARKSTGAHDRLTARCLVVDGGSQKLAFVSCDLIGLPRIEVERIRAQVQSVPKEHVIVAGTHTHSGPDTLGMWGPVLTRSGVDAGWLAATCKSIGKMIDKTSAALVPASVKFASTTDVPRISKNIRVPRILDTQLAVMQVVSAGNGSPIATIVNYACHPEILNNRELTADFPQWLYETVEAGGGGECIYFNGAQGGMITADFDEKSAPKGQNWEAARSIGSALGNRALEIIRGAKPAASSKITFNRKVFRVPLENARYKALINMKVFAGTLSPDGSIETEASRIEIGPAEFLTIPGEALPNVGFYLKSKMKGSPTFLLGLTNDFLGYILAPEDFGLELYGYESGQSVGRQMEPALVKCLFELMDLRQ